MIRTFKAALTGLAGLLAALAPAQAADPSSSLFYEMKAGVLWHDVPNLWSGFALETGNRVDLNAEVVFSPFLPFLYGAIRPAVGATINTGGFTSHAYADARWEIGGPAGLYFATGLGAAVHDGDLSPDHSDRKALGSRVLFHIPAELGWRFDGHHGLSVYFEHTSNANTGRYNEALDRLGVRYGYKF